MSGVKQVSEPLVNSKGTAAVLNVTPTTDPSDRATADLVQRLRDTTVPKAEQGNDMTVNVGGQTAGYVDLASEISSRLIITIAVVVALSFVLLVLAFRSIVIPLTAGLMNLVSIGAAFGVVTAVFEKGWGASLVGLEGSVPIVSFVPLMMFAILFGLSMDYEVFLMTHIREHWLGSGDNRQSVIAGVGTTGRVITSAALIMVSVFFAFILNGDPTVKQFGVGMGVAVAVDATLVRCLLVPAVMVLIGTGQLVVPALARPDRPELLDRGRAVVPRPRRRGGSRRRGAGRGAGHAGAGAVTAAPTPLITSPSARRCGAGAARGTARWCAGAARRCPSRGSRRSGGRGRARRARRRGSARATSSGSSSSLASRAPRCSSRSLLGGVLVDPVLGELGVDLLDHDAVVQRGALDRHVAVGDVLEHRRRGRARAGRRARRRRPTAARSGRPP